MITRVLIGPANHAGQAAAWASALEKHQHVQTDSLRVRRRPRALGGPVLDYPTSQTLPWSTLTTRRSRSRRAHRLLNHYSHLALDGFFPILGSSKDLLSADELHELSGCVSKLVLIAHGSDVRSPTRHMDRLDDSYFGLMDSSMVDRLTAVSASNRGLVAQLRLPTLVSTPDLLLDLPDASWLPVVVQTDVWRQPRRGCPSRPRVLHAPSSSIKGSDVIDPVLSDLDRRGLIDYVRVSSVRHTRMPVLVGSSDIVVDQIRSGFYGVAAVEAMAAGCVTIGNVAKDVRALVPDAIPIIDACPTTFHDVVVGLLEERGKWPAISEAGLRYVSKWHSGHQAAMVLAKALAISTS